MTERVDAGVMATWWGVRPRWSTTGGHRRAAEGSRGVGAGRNLAGQRMAPDQPGRTAGCRRRPSGDFHLFAVDITEVGHFAVVGDEHDVRRWAPEGAPTWPATRHLSKPSQSCNNATTMRTTPINPSIILVLVS